MRAFLALLTVAAAFAGCTDDSASEDPVPVPPATTPFLLGEMPSGQSARDFIESYIMTHPFRVGSASNPVYQQYMEAARTDLVALLESFGGNLSVVREEYSGGQNIVAYKNGTTYPDQWVVLSAHYDSIGVGFGTTVYGAWDDGAGTAALIELARASADWRLPYTLVFAFFDGEEKGLVGSREFVNLHTEENVTEDIVANLNTDPPGLNWPCGDAGGPFPVKIIHEMDKVATNATQGNATDRFTWLYQAIEHGLNTTAVPPAVVDYSPGIPIAAVNGQGLSGGSDHQSFGGVSIANVYIGGVPTSTVPPGQIPEDAAVAALTYPLHTPLDTLQAMEARCTGGAGTLADGMQTTVSIFAHALSWMALNPAPAPSA